MLNLRLVGSGGGGGEYIIKKFKDENERPIFQQSFTTIHSNKKLWYQYLFIKFSYSY